MPSIGLSILKSIAARQNREVTIEYLGFSLARAIGLELYNTLSSGYPTNTTLAGEYLFSIPFFNKSQGEIDTYISNHIKKSRNNNNSRIGAASGNPNFHKIFETQYRNAATKLSSWIKLEGHRLASKQADLYGFTSMFQQNLASLCIAREIRHHHPSAIIAFGGPNTEGIMGEALLKNFAEIDLVCTGEAENSFISLLEYIEHRKKSRLHSNILYRGKPKNLGSKNQISFVDLEKNPKLDYSDYFQQLENNFSAKQIQPRVLLETSRGCWWGEKNHCTFCGLNGQSMSFRSKSAKQALDEILHLHVTYPKVPISVVDNIIDYKYFKTLIPTIIERELKIDLFYETKANLTKHQLLDLRAAGIKRIQPGIESLSTNVLKLMKKGIKAIQNVSLLKWCVEAGVKPEWNVIWGFPGEKDLDYEEMSNLIKKIRHLPPPNASSNLRLDRFSPLHVNRGDEITNIRPYHTYEQVYSKNATEDVANLAYYFEFDYIKPKASKNATSLLQNEIEKWRKSYSSAYLIYNFCSEYVLVFDRRNFDTPRVTMHDSPAGDILTLCERAQSEAAIVDKLKDVFDLDAITTSIEKLKGENILIKLDGLIYNIAVSLTELQNAPGFAFRSFINDAKQSGGEFLIV